MDRMEMIEQPASSPTVLFLTSSTDDDLSNSLFHGLCALRANSTGRQVMDCLREMGFPQS
jgi:hypothetical protein